MANLFGLIDVPLAFKSMFQLAFGHFTDEEKTYIPLHEHFAAILTARVWLIIYGLTVALAIGSGSILPLMVIGLPRLYGAWHMTFTGILQNAALAENVVEHRLNSRSIFMSPISCFVYWNMNYHVEQHMFTMVTCHKVPALHERQKGDLPAPNSSILDAI